MKVYAVGRSDVPPLDMPDRFRTEIAYFMTAPDEPHVPDLQPGEYWIEREKAQEWLEQCTVTVVSPLDAASKAEIELSEEQEAWLEWLLEHDVQHVRIG